jgi:hypothetical protein
LIVATSSRNDQLSESGVKFLFAIPLRIANAGDLPALDHASAALRDMLIRARLYKARKLSVRTDSKADRVGIGFEIDGSTDRVVMAVADRDRDGPGVPLRGGSK